MDCMGKDLTKWSLIADKIPGRIGKQCRERWSNHLDPSLMKGEWTKEEDIALIQAQVLSLNLIHDTIRMMFLNIYLIDIC